MEWTGGGLRRALGLSYCHAMPCHVMSCHVIMPCHVNCAGVWNEVWNGTWNGMWNGMWNTAQAGFVELGLSYERGKAELKRQLPTLIEARQAATRLKSEMETAQVV